MSDALSDIARGRYYSGEKERRFCNCNDCHRLLYCQVRKEEGTDVKGCYRGVGHE